MCCSVLQCVAVCCSVLLFADPLVAAQATQGRLKCVAVCCSVLWCVAVCCSVFQCVTVRCSVLQCVAVCRLPRCSAVCKRQLAVCCSVLQYVAVCCSVLTPSLQHRPRKNSQPSVCCYMYITKMNSALTFENFCQRTNWPLLRRRRVASRQATTCTM